MRQDTHPILRFRLLPVPAVAVLLLATTLQTVHGQTRRPARLALAQPVIVTELPTLAPAPSPTEMLRRAAAPPDLDGTFIGEYTTSAAPGAVRRASLQVTQGGNSVTGSFVTADGRRADVSGRMDGTRLEATLRFRDECGGSTRLTARLLPEGDRLRGRLTMSDCEGEHIGSVALRSTRIGHEAERSGPQPRGFAGPGRPGGTRRTYRRIAVASAIEADIARIVAALLLEQAAAESEPELFAAPPPLPGPTAARASVLDLTAGGGAGALLLFDIETLALDQELQRTLGQETSTRVTAVLYDTRSGVPVWAGARDFVAPADGDEDRTDRGDQLIRAARQLLVSFLKAAPY